MRNTFRRYGVAFLVTAFVFAFLFMMDSGELSAKSIKLNKKSVCLGKGDSDSLKVSGTSKKVKWKSSNKKIVTVSAKGRLKAKGIGKATVTAVVKGKKLQCKVVVEKKSANRARKLWSYVLKKGKYDKYDKNYYLEKQFTDKDGNKDTVRIAATKNSKLLEFYHYGRGAGSDAARSVTMKIDLISGKESIQTGEISSHYAFHGSWDEKDHYADITTGFDGKGAGLTLTKAVIQEEEEDGWVTKEYTKPEELAVYFDDFNGWTNNAFNYWNKFFKSKKDLKGITMATLGFSKWKK